MHIMKTLAPIIGLFLWSAVFAQEKPLVTLTDKVNVSAAHPRPELSKYQTDLRSHPTDPKVFAIAAKIESRPDLAERDTIVFVTKDGGVTWSHELLEGSGDPDVVFGAKGELIWSFISKGVDKSKPLGVRRSLDGGKTWDERRVPDASVQIDHPHSVVDRSAGKFAGSTYVAGRSFAGGGIVVGRSRDAGATFAFTTVPLEGKLGLGFVFGMAVLQNGELLIPLITANDIQTDDRGHYAGNRKTIYCLRSTDGGETFAAPVRVTDLISPGGQGVGGSAALGGFATGKTPRGQRVYLTYAQPRAEKQPAQLMICTSDDAGATWSPPRVAVDNPHGTGAGSSCVMTNADGVVGIQWYAMTSDKQFDIYFTASTDSGATFCEPVRVSSGTSTEPPAEARYPGQDQVYGDVSPDGAFRLVWTDARKNAKGYAVYFREARVGRR